MAKPIDDTKMLDAIADAIVSKKAMHPTAALRAAGVTRGSAVERRIQRKWAEGHALLLSRARERSAFERGRQAGLAEAMKPLGTSIEIARPAPKPRRSWLSGFFSWSP